jgi:DNA polymerase (family 10)
LAKILDQATNLNYECIGLSDHTPKFTGLTDKQKDNIISARKLYLQAHYHSYEKRVKNRVPKLLIGLEVDIRSDGQRAITDSLLEKLDYAIVSLHSNLTLDSTANTQRIIRGLDHPKAVILGHPTGRMLNSRDSIQADWDKIFDFCAKNHKIIEINASPLRLDLPNDLVREATKYSVRFCINTDSHSLSQMQYMKYGVWQARRGWAQKKDIVNAFSYKNLLSVLNL